MEHGPFIDDLPINLNGDFPYLCYLKGSEGYPLPRWKSLAPFHPNGFYTQWLPLAIHILRIAMAIPT